MTTATDMDNMTDEELQSFASQLEGVVVAKPETNMPDFDSMSDEDLLAYATQLEQGQDQENRYTDLSEYYGGGFNLFTFEGQELNMSLNKGDLLLDNSRGMRMLEFDFRDSIRPLAICTAALTAANCGLRNNKSLAGCLDGNCCQFFKACSARACSSTNVSSTLRSSACAIRKAIS